MLSRIGLFLVVALLITSVACRGGGSDDESDVEATATFGVTSVATLTPTAVPAPSDDPAQTVARVDPDPGVVPSGAQVRFRVFDASGSELVVADWSLNQPDRGEPGTVSADGLYEAPPAPPQPEKVKLTAITLSGDSFVVEFSIVAAGQVSRVEVLPVPDALAIGARVQFSATVDGLSAPVRWLVNGVEGGGAAGSITNTGLFKAPGIPPTGLKTVTVRAVSQASPAAFADVTFPYEEVQVSPATFSASNPGDSTPLTVISVRTDGSRENITGASTTHIEIARPLIVQAGTDGRSLVLQQETGTTQVAVTDTRLDPPAVGFVVVEALPNLTLKVEAPSPLRSVFTSTRAIASVGVVPDRGKLMGQLQDMRFSPELSISVKSGSAVVAAGSAPPRADDLTAWWDTDRGEVVFGEKAGTAQFQFSWEDQKATLAVELVDLELLVTRRVNYFQSYEPGQMTSAIEDQSQYPVYSDTLEQMGQHQSPFAAPFADDVDPSLVITLPGAVLPNEALHINVTVRARNGSPGAVELQELLLGAGVEFKDSSGKGRWRTALEAFDDSSHQQVGVAPRTAGTGDTHRVDPRIPRGLWYSGPAASANFLPGVTGAQSLEVTLPGTTAQTRTVSLEGRLPDLGLVVDRMDGASPYESDQVFNNLYAGQIMLSIANRPWAGECIDFETLRGSCAAYNFRGFEYELGGEGPGGKLSKGDWIRLPMRGVDCTRESLQEEVINNRKSIECLYGPRFLVNASQIGKWEFWVTIVGHSEKASNVLVLDLTGRPGLDVLVSGSPTEFMPWSGPIKVQVSTKDAKGDATTFAAQTVTVVSDGNTSEYRKGPRVTPVGGAKWYNALGREDRTVTTTTSFDGSALSIQCDSTDATRGLVRIGLDSGTGSIYQWGNTEYATKHWTPISGNSFTITVTMVHPIDPACELWYGLDYAYNDLIPAFDSSGKLSGYIEKDIVMDRASVHEIPYYVVEEGAAFLVAAPEFTIAPSVVFVPNSGTVERTFGVSGTTVLSALTGGTTVNASAVRIVDAQGSAVVGVSVSSVTQLERSVTVKLSINTTIPAFKLGDYRLNLDLGRVQADLPLSLARLLVSGPASGSTDVIPALPLNAKLAYTVTGVDMPGAGVIPFEVQVEGTDRPVVPVLRVSSPNDSGSFRLVGFSRSCTTRGSDMATICFVDTPSAQVWLSGAPTQRQVGADRASLLLYGNLTDVEWKSLTRGKTDQPRPDGLPDIVSGKIGDVRIDLVDGVGTTLAPGIGTTTAFNYIAVPAGELRTGALFPGAGGFTKYQTAVDSLSWFDGDTDFTGSLKIKKRPDQDFQVEVDNGVNGSDTPNGMLDMGYLNLSGKGPNGESLNRPAVPGARFHDFPGESPRGAPVPADKLSVVTGSPSSKLWGLELDGVCYDPGWGLDEAPNSAVLFDNSKESYSTYTVADGLIAGAGGASGGTLDTATGGFSLVLRTPGADFPYLDCGYLVEGRPDGLKSALGLKDDIESVTFNNLAHGEVGAAVPDLGYDYPFRVTPFTTYFDSQKWLTAGMSVVGDNAAFRITTDPALPDGSPIVDSRISAGMVLRPEDLIKAGKDDIILTARKDAAAEVSAKIKRAAVTASLAALSAASGGIAPAIAAGGIALAIHVAGEEGIIPDSGILGNTVVGGATGSAISDTGKKTLAQVYRGSSPVFVKAGATASPTFASAGAGMAAGLIANLINSHIGVDASDFGHSQAYLIEQVALIIPAGVPTGDTSCSTAAAEVGAWGVTTDARTIWTVQMVHASLNGQTGDPLATKLPAPNEEGVEYWQLERPGLSPMLVVVRPGESLEGLKDVMTLHGKVHPDAQLDPRPTADYRLCVGGDNASVLPFFHSVVAAVSRSSEEGTAQVHVNRDTPFRLDLMDLVVYETRNK